MCLASIKPSRNAQVIKPFFTTMADTVVKHESGKYLSH